MYNNDYMYAIERSDEYLAHYGIRGMKWGVRKAIASGNSARLGRQYAKAQKKLAKLEKQAGKSKKYARRAALMGAGAAAAGGLAAAGTTGVSKGIAKLGGATMKVSKSVGRGLTLVPGRNKVSQALHNTGVAMYRAGDRGSELHKGFANVSGAVNKWGNSNSLIGAGRSAGKGVANAFNKVGLSGAGERINAAVVKGSNKAYKSGITNNTIARIGAGAVGAGLAAGAARNAYKAATAKKKAERFRTEMNKAFAGTQYAKGGNQQSSKPRQGKKRRK